MNIYFNENSLPILSKIECIEEYTTFVSESLSILSQQIKEIQKNGYHVFYFDNDKIQQFRKELDTGTTKTAFNRILGYLTAENDTYSTHSYTFFQHPNLPINECLAYSTEIEYGALQYAATIQNTEKIKILNFPNTIFSLRPFIPIIKSDADANKKDEFIFLNCIEIQANFHLSLFLETTIKPILSDKYDVFYTKYMDFYKNFDFSMWNPNQNPFPAHHIIHEYLKDKMEKEKTGKGFNEKETIHEKWGEAMAILNFYTFDEGISNLNQKDTNKKRRIFSAGNGKNKMYLSTDFQHGEMEICDHNGKHLCEIYTIDKGKHVENNFKEGDADWKTHCIKTER